MKFCPTCDVWLKKNSITLFLTCPKCNYAENAGKPEKQSTTYNTEFPIMDEKEIEKLDGWGHGNLNFASAVRQSDKYEQKFIEKDENVTSKVIVAEIRAAQARKIAKETEEVRKEKENALKITGWDGITLSSELKKNQKDTGINPDSISSNQGLWWHEKKK